MLLDGFCVRCKSLCCGLTLVLTIFPKCRNKAVLSNSPDLPLLFLLLQLLIAVILLHASATVSKKIDLPRFDIQVAKKLIPVVLVNIIGLVFNTLCLRDVEASFFQVTACLSRSHFKLLMLTSHVLDCKRPCPSPHNPCFVASHAYFSHNKGRFGCSCCHRWIFHRCCSIFIHPSDGSSIVAIVVLWCFILSFYRLACCAHQEFAAALQQLHHSTGMVDKRRLCCLPPSGSNFPWRNCSTK